MTDDERREIDLEWRRTIRDSLGDLQARVANHIDAEEQKLENVLAIVRRIETQLPEGHLKQHDVWLEWIEERKFMTELRREAVKKGFLWTISILAIFALTRLFPAIEKWIR